MTTVGRLLLGVLLLGAVPRVQAASYFVDFTSGADANIGSIGAPWKTLTKVNATTFQPGDTINFKRGSVWTGTLGVDSNGTSGAPIRYQAYGTGAAPVIQTAAAHETSGFTSTMDVTGTYNVVQDFLLRNAHFVGVYLFIGADHNTIQQNEITQVGHGVIIKSQFNVITGNAVHDLQMVVNDAAADNDYGAVGFWFHGAASNNEVSYNSCINCRAPSIDYGFDGGFLEFWGNGQTVTNVSIHHNYAENTVGFSETGGGGTLSNVTWSYNIINNIPEGSFCFHDSGGFAINHVNMRIENNTIYKQGPGGGKTFNCMSAAAWLTVRNNIIYSNINLANAIPGVHTNNIYFLTGGATIGYTLGAGESTANPLFVNAATGNFSLQAGSPAINAGASLGYTLDYVGTSVPQGAAPDLGAYEFLSTATPPLSPPTNVHVVP